ncbi:MAG: metalloregulator ArsR/SmtB family transcription factor [Pyrinomonadaceae bacterium]|nr:metalloregulator ArsR/SmtB family transcription factor [Pyrinomonadaceae bacterium]
MASKRLTDEAFELIALRFKILSEPLRLKIIHLLQEGEKSVSELKDELNTSQPNVSKHLRILQDAGLVNRRQEGNLVYYSIADESVFALCETVCSSLEQRFKNQARIFT